MDNNIVFTGKGLLLRCVCTVSGSLGWLILLLNRLKDDSVRAPGDEIIPFIFQIIRKNNLINYSLGL